MRSCVDSSLPVARGSEEINAATIVSLVSRDQSARLDEVSEPQRDVPFTGHGSDAGGGHVDSLSRHLGADLGTCSRAQRSS